MQLLGGCALVPGGEPVELDLRFTVKGRRSLGNPSLSQCAYVSGVPKFLRSSCLPFPLGKFSNMCNTEVSNLVCPVYAGKDIEHRLRVIVAIPEIAKSAGSSGIDSVWTTYAKNRRAKLAWSMPLHTIDSVADANDPPENE